MAFRVVALSDLITQQFDGHTFADRRGIGGGGATGVDRTPDGARSEGQPLHGLGGDAGRGGYYGQEFNAGALPRTADLEIVGKRALENSLHRATQHTQKGTYHKIRHASDLLRRMNAETVKARGPHCRRPFDELGQMIDAA